MYISIFVYVYRTFCIVCFINMCVLLNELSAVVYRIQIYLHAI